MGADSFTRDVVSTLREVAREKHLSIVVGAGASVAAGLPDWPGLIRGLLVQGNGRREDLEEVADLLYATQGPLLALEAALWNVTTAEERKDRLARVLYAGVGSGPEHRKAHPRDLHFAVAELARARGQHALKIFTTNYDDLLEAAFELQKLSCYSRHQREDPLAGDFGIHHIHGLLGSRTVPHGGGVGFAESPDVVVTQMDYLRLYNSFGEDWPAEAIGDAASRGALVFVGTSLTDPNLIRYLHRVRSPGAHKHVLVLSRQGLGSTKEGRPLVSEERLPLVKRHLRGQWRSIGVEPVLLEDHADAAVFVQELAHLSHQGNGYRSPVRRVRQIWRALEGDFDHRQEEFSEALRADFASHLASLLGSEANLLLWLSDGAGHLVRFAANDRIFHSRETLRRLPYRHDTGWVVSEALAFGNVTVRTPLTHPLAVEYKLLHSRWKSIAAAPLKVTLAGHPMLTVGAVSAATTSPLSDDEKRALGEIMDGTIAPEWAGRLAKT